MHVQRLFQQLIRHERHRHAWDDFVVLWQDAGVQAPHAFLRGYGPQRAAKAALHHSCPALALHATKEDHLLYSPFLPSNRGPHLPASLLSPHVVAEGK